MGIYTSEAVFLGLLPRECALRLAGVPVVEETKFLGVVFDRKLPFIPHIKTLKR